jgi:hypothetical protein
LSNLQCGPHQKLDTILSVDPCFRLPLPITIHYTFNYWPLGGKGYQVRDHLGGRNFKGLLTKLAQNLKLMASLQVVVASSKTKYLTQENGHIWFITKMQNEEEKCEIGESFHIGVSINIMHMKHQIPLQSCDVVFNKINGLFYHLIFINLVSVESEEH